MLTASQTCAPPYFLAVESLIGPGPAAWVDDYQAPTIGFAVGDAVSIDPTTHVYRLDSAGCHDTALVASQLGSDRWFRVATVAVPPDLAAPLSVE